MAFELLSRLDCELELPLIEANVKIAKEPRLAKEPNSLPVQPWYEPYIRFKLDATAKVNLKGVIISLVRGSSHSSR